MTRGGGHVVVVNADLIETVESIEGDTVVTLTTGNVLNVTESPHDVIEAVVAYRRRLSGELIK